MSVQAEVGNAIIDIHDLASDYVDEVMLGNYFLHDHEATRKLRDGHVELYGRKFKLCGATRKNWCRRVVLQTDISVPPGSEVVLPKKVVYNDLCTPITSCQVWATEARMLPSGLQRLEKILPDDRVNVCVLDPKKQGITLKSGDVVRDLETFQVCHMDDTTSCVVRW